MNFFVVLLLLPVLLVMRLLRWGAGGREVSLPTWVALLLSLAAWIGAGLLVARAIG